MNSCNRIVIAFAAAAIFSLSQSQASERVDKVLMQGNPAGSQTLRSESADSTQAEYSLNDRGRGDHIIAASPGMPPDTPFPFPSEL
jgi:hypothetical protein